MKTLIVDDQYQEKSQTIAATLKEIGAPSPQLVASTKDALRKMQQEKYDLLILDLQIPENLGDDPNPIGGKNLLEYIEVNQKIYRPTSVLAITSHKESYDSCRDFFMQRGWSLLLGVDDPEKIRSILMTQKQHLPSMTETFDIAIITALSSPELDAVLELPCDWTKFEVVDDDNIYHRGTVVTADGSTRNIVATSAPHMGMAAAAALTATVCVKFKPSLLIMTGIAAGVPGKTEIGDILIADPSWDWGSGKITVKKDGGVAFLSAPRKYHLTPRCEKACNSSLPTTFI